ncbi:unnamed protein product [Darwinula stevensoni]|uniref:Beta-catenin-like protein 1 n=1 Tax=Darwinula stevensoni TaxID=69355 RepID=A0A7R8X0T1_9CRUS|nr:unnamed protein product [Darwinula stevensoni]CAG0879498.1 unnamed protein product [Darwinula stevensoni]
MHGCGHELAIVSHPQEQGFKETGTRSPLSENDVLSLLESSLGLSPSSACGNSLVSISSPFDVSNILGIIQVHSPDGTLKESLMPEIMYKLEKKPEIDLDTLLDSLQVDLYARTEDFGTVVHLLMRPDIDPDLSSYGSLNASRLSPDMEFLNEMSFLYRFPQERDKFDFVFFANQVAIQRDMLMKRGTPLVAGVNVNTMAAIAEEYGLDSPQFLDAKRLLADTVSVIAETLWDLSQGKSTLVVMTGAKRVHRVRRQAEGQNDSPVSGGGNSAGIFNIMLWLTVGLLLTTIAISVGIANMDPGRDSIIYRMTTLLQSLQHQVSVQRGTAKREPSITAKRPVDAVKGETEDDEVQARGKRSKTGAHNPVVLTKSAASIGLPLPGISEEDKDKIFELLEKESETENLDEALVKKMILTFEKKSLKNQEMRIKYPDQPEKFMETEVDLNDAIQELHVLATVPDLYHVLVQQNVVPSLLNLLSHENTDISTAVVNLLQELTDVDTLNESEEGAAVLIDTLLENQICALLVQNMERLDESLKEEADGVHNSLAIIENITEFRPEVCVDAAEQGVLSWILKRIRMKMPFDANKLYASEILSILLQSHEQNRKTLGEVDGIDILLQQLAFYKRHDPSSSEESEMMENLFDCLCSSLMYIPNRDRFLKGEGLQLMNLMLREKKLSRNGALRVLNHALSNTEGIDNCNKFVEILGLRTVFPLFMKTPHKHGRKGLSPDEHEEHVCSVVASLLKNTQGNLRQRLMNKFTENDYEKVDRLMELHFKYLEKVQKVDAEIEEERRTLSTGDEEVDAAREDEFYLKRLESGLFTLQVVDYIMLEVCASGPAGIKGRVMHILNLRGGSVKSIRNIMRGGGTGFIGSVLVKQLKRHGYDVIVVSRKRGPSQITWALLNACCDGYLYLPHNTDLATNGLPENCKAVVNLAGQNILDPQHRWTTEFKQAVWTSRIQTTESLVKAMVRANAKPEVFVSTSAIGFYPPSETVENTEDSPGGSESDFLTKLCAAWEQAAMLPPEVNIRHVIIRSGIVLGRQGGIIQNLIWPFFLGLGGPVGSGKQYFPWIHIHDIASLFLHAIEKPNLSGILNGVAPQIITNGEFTKSLGQAMWRPAFIPVPEMVINLVFGEERGKIMTQGQKVIPKRTLESGFQYCYPDIKSACMECARSENAFTSCESTVGLAAFETVSEHEIERGGGNDAGRASNGKAAE